MLLIRYEWDVRLLFCIFLFRVIYQVDNFHYKPTIINFIFYFNVDMLRETIWFYLPKALLLSFVGWLL